MTGRKRNLTETARALNSGAIHLLRAMRVVDRAAGLTPARLSALSVLVFGGSQTLGRLAEAEEVASPTMTRVVDGLAELGLVERAPHPDNRRMTVVSATTAGTELMHAAAARRLEHIAAALRKLPSDDRAALVAAAPALVRLAEVARRDVQPG